MQKDIKSCVKGVALTSTRKHCSKIKGAVKSRSLHFCLLVLLSAEHSPNIHCFNNFCLN